jgi:alginate O-acetyltransferase complex protein AlgI
MQINSLSYLFFLFAAVAIFRCIPVGWRPIFVLAVSLFFYATWNTVFVVVPLSICVVVYAAGRLMIANPAQSRRWMWLGITMVIAALAFFKYRNFAIANWNSLMVWFGARPLSFATAIALPLGISFYSFEAISYLIDVRQNRLESPRFSSLCLFIMFWPHLIAGPIVRARELIPQLSFESKCQAGLIFAGVDRLIWGLVQKNVIANTLGMWVDSGFLSTSVRLPSTPDSWFMAIAFGLQIYFDFAGYSNIAIGAAGLLGITLPENFRYPYHAANPADFWSRWHITLSRWVRDYLFFPLNTRFRGSRTAVYTSLIGTMALVGLWHGAGWGFVLWGVLHGTYLVAYRIIDALAEGRVWLKARAPAAALRIATIIVIIAAWVPFRAVSVHKAGQMLAAMFFRPSAGMEYSRSFYLFTAATALFCVVEPYVARKLAPLDLVGDTLPSWWIAARPLAYVCGLALFMVFDEGNVQFIYFQF